MAKPTLHIYRSGCAVDPVSCESLGSLFGVLATRTHALTKNADRLALWVLRAFVVIAAPAAVSNAVDLGHHPLPFCHCV